MFDSGAPTIPLPFSVDLVPSLGQQPAEGGADDDFFEFIGDLSIMESDVPDVSPHMSSGESTSQRTAQAPAAPAAQPRKTSKASAEERIDRIREKNRAAQARFRQKQKARPVSVSTVPAAPHATLARLTQLLLTF